MHRWLNQLAVENPRNVFKTYRGGKTAEVLSTESRASASEVPWGNEESKRARCSAKWMAYNVQSTVRKLGVRVQLLISEVGRLLRASRSRAAGPTFFVRSCPDQSLSEYPIETLTRQCVYLALLIVSGATARHPSPQETD